MVTATEIVTNLVKCCVDCGKEFTLTAGERRFYTRKGLQEPKRCRSCRQIKRESDTPEDK